MEGWVSQIVKKLRQARCPQASGGFVEFIEFIEFMEFVETGDSWRYGRDKSGLLGLLSS